MKRSNAPKQKPAPLDGLYVDDESAAGVLYFLASVQPLEECEYEDDQRLRYGRSLILQWLQRCYVASDATKAAIMTAEEPDREQALYECASLMYFLGHSYKTEAAKQRPDPAYLFDLGRAIILAWIEARLLRVSGFDGERPHKTTLEREEADRAAAGGAT